MASPQLLLGILLLVGGVLLIFSGQFRAVLLLFLGIVRTTTAWGISRPSKERQDRARDEMLRLGDDARAQCAVHPAHAAMGTCPRCGSYCCALCTPGRGFADGYVCMTCEALAEVQAQRRRGAARGAAVTLLAAPATIVLLLAIERFISASNPQPWVVLVVLLVGSAPWLMLAALQANVRNGWPMALGFILWLTMEVLLVRGARFIGAGVWLIPLGVIFYGWESIRQAARGEPAFILERSE